MTNSKIILVLFACLVFPAVISAEIPADYAGTPYLGEARAIPGRIDFEEYDMGGVNIAWKWDNKAGDGLAPGSHASIRANDGENSHPAFYTSNPGDWEHDVFSAEDGGGTYPSDENPMSDYGGAAHNGDWATWTVDVAETGTYYVSTTWATETGDGGDFNLVVDGVDVTGKVETPTTASYHIWKVHTDMCTLELDAGLHTIRFNLMAQHINCDYLYFAAAPGGEVAMGSPERQIRNLTVSRNADGSFQYMLPESGHVQAVIHDMTGRAVATVLNGFMDRGSHILRADMGKSAPGRYIISINQNGQAMSRSFYRF